MTISKKIEDALNKQINAEWYSAYLYMSMSAFFESVNLRGFANWMYVQSLEELTHGKKIYDHLIERGGRVILQAIELPPEEWKGPLDVFESALKHEQHVTSLIHDLVELASKEKDYAASNMLQWFVDEQVEEESSADEIVKQLTMMKDAPGGIFMLDQKLGARKFKS